MTKTQKKTDKKRHGLHHKQNKHFMSTYWPYLPSVLALLLTIGIVMMQPLTLGKMLAYSTDVSSSGLLQSTNKQRLANNTSELKLDDRLTRAAQAKADDMARRDYWSHTTPEGKEPWIFIDAAGYEYQKAGENLAYGFLSSASAVEGWMNSPSHKANLLDPSFNAVGFGYASAANYQSDGEQTVVVAMYASSEKSVAAASYSSPIQAVNSDHTLFEPAVQSVAVAEALTNSQSPWVMLVIGVVSGAAVSILIIRHSLKFRHLLRNSEKFVIHHPVIDTTLLVIIVLGVFLAKDVAFIR